MSSSDPEGQDARAAGEPRARRVAPGSFLRSFLGAAARGTGLIALAVGIGVVLLQYSDDPGPDGFAVRSPVAGEQENVPPPESTTTTTTAAVRPPAEVTVLVLNGAGRAGVAGAMSDRLEVVGYPTLEPGNASRRRESSVLCRAGLDREAGALAAATGLAAEVGELSPATGLPGAAGADCVVVIGSG